MPSSCASMHMKKTDTTPRRCSMDAMGILLLLSLSVGCSMHSQQAGEPESTIDPVLPTPTSGTVATAHQYTPTPLTTLEPAVESMQTATPSTMPTPTLIPTLLSDSGGIWTHQVFTDEPWPPFELRFRESWTLDPEYIEGYTVLTHRTLSDCHIVANMARGIPEGIPTGILAKDLRQVGGIEFSRKILGAAEQAEWITYCVNNGPDCDSCFQAHFHPSEQLICIQEAETVLRTLICS